MTPATVFVSKPAKRATPWSSWTTKSPVRRSVNERSAPRRGRSSLRSARRRRNSRCSGMTASFSPAAMNPSRRFAWAKRRSSGVSSPIQPAFRRVRLYRARSPSPRRGQAIDGAVARAQQLLELGLGLLQRARRRLRGLGVELDGLVGGQRRQREARAPADGGADRVRMHVEMTGVVVVERGADVLPVVAQRRLDLLLGGDEDVGLGGEVQERAEAVDGEQLGDVGALVLQRGDLGDLAMLGGELGRRGDLHRVGVPQRPLREGREPAQRLDLDVEQVDADRPVLRCRVDVEDAAAHRELTAVLDLVDALVAGRDEIARDLVEIDEVADAQRHRARAQLGVRDLLAQRDRGHDDDRRLPVASARAARPSRRRGGRRGAAAAPSVTRMSHRGWGRSGPGAARATRGGRRRGRGPGGRRRRRPARDVDRPLPGAPR